MGDDVTGELRDSLAVIHSSVTLLRRRLGGDPRACAQLERIVAHLDKMSALLVHIERTRTPE